MRQAEWYCHQLIFTIICYDSHYLDGGLESWNILLFLSLPGEMIHFDSYSSNGLKPPTRIFFVGSCYVLGDFVQGVSVIILFFCFFVYCSIGMIVHRARWVESERLHKWGSPNDNQYLNF